MLETIVTWALIGAFSLMFPVLIILSIPGGSRPARKDGQTMKRPIEEIVEETFGVRPHMVPVPQPQPSPGKRPIQEIIDEQMSTTVPSQPRMVPARPQPAKVQGSQPARPQPAMVSPSQPVAKGSQLTTARRPIEDIIAETISQPGRANSQPAQPARATMPGSQPVPTVSQPARAKGSQPVGFRPAGSQPETATVPQPTTSFKRNEVVRLLASGMSQGAVAAQLGITQQMVSKYKSQAAKLSS